MKSKDEKRMRSHGESKQEAKFVETSPVQEQEIDHVMEIVPSLWGLFQISVHESTNFHRQQPFLLPPSLPTVPVWT